VLILFIPGAFMMGGLVASSLLMMASAVVTTVCAVKLINVGLALETFNYGQLVDLAFGQQF
jgi:hypothetical protein